PAQAPRAELAQHDRMGHRGDRAADRGVGRQAFVRPGSQPLPLGEAGESKPSFANPSYDCSWTSQPGSVSPSATITAGPVSRLLASPGVTVSVPPGTVTTHRSDPLPGHRPVAVAAATAAATAPVPHDRVSPEPRSCTRISTRRSPVSLTTSTLTPPGKSAGST